MVELKEPKKIESAKLLLTVEKKRKLTPDKEAHAAEEVVERKKFGVLLPAEVEEAKVKVSEDGQLTLVLQERKEKKLTSAGILWRPGETHPELARDVFAEDTGDDLSPLERDVIETQAQAYLGDKAYNSVLLPVTRLMAVAASCGKGADGKPLRQEFLEKAVDLALAVDDLRDMQKRRAA